MIEGGDCHCHAERERPRDHSISPSRQSSSPYLMPFVSCFPTHEALRIYGFILTEAYCSCTCPPPLYVLHMHTWRRVHACVWACNIITCICRGGGGGGRVKKWRQQRQRLLSHMSFYTYAWIFMHAGLDRIGIGSTLINMQHQEGTQTMRWWGDEVVFFPHMLAGLGHTCPRCALAICYSKSVQ